MNYFRLFAVGVLCVATATSCTKEPADDFAVPAAETATVDANDHRVPVDAALEGLRSLLDQIDATTRSAAPRKIREVLPLRSRRVLTRTLESGTDRPDTLLYLVNFSDEAGYAVLGADDRMAPILALVDGGSVSPDDFTDDSIGLDKKLILNYAEQLPDSWNADTTYVDTNSASFPGDSVIFRYAGRTIKFKVESYFRPLLSTKWRQQSPFNDCFPVSVNSFDKLPYVCSAGCWMVALGQTMAYLEYPQHDTLNWAGMKQVWNVENYDNHITRDSSAVNNYAVAQLLLRLYSVCRATLIRPKEAGHGDVAGTSIERVCRYLPELGFKDLEIKDYDLNNIIDVILAGKPCLMTGTDGSVVDANDGSHAWVMDGYMKVSLKRELGYHLIAPYNPYLHLFHCNWGWGGVSDGYYVSTMFSVYSGGVLEDPNSRDDLRPVTKPDRNFTKNLRWLSYAY